MHVAPRFQAQADQASRPNRDASLVFERSSTVGRGALDSREAAREFDAQNRVMELDKPVNPTGRSTCSVILQTFRKS